MLRGQRAAHPTLFAKHFRCASQPDHVLSLARFAMDRHKQTADGPEGLCHWYRRWSLSACLAPVPV